MANKIDIQLLKDKVLEGNYSLEVCVKIDSDVHSKTCRETGHSISGEVIISVWDENNQKTQTEIGYISAFRSVSNNLSAVRFWSDSINQDLYEAFNWLLEEKFFPETDLLIDEVLYNSPVLLDRVFIEPEWRGYGFALRAVAAFLDLSRATFVFLIPAPFDKTLSEEERNVKAKTLKRYWEKLGFENYDPQNNVLWTECWKCPQWLRGSDDSY
ncbi:MAG: hypothetical protein F6K19_18785 [Cyanothece sp. SIO1E1]|nr:hypothetical protein [Cyanothece sp. SIO1E1]